MDTTTENVTDLDNVDDIPIPGSISDTPAPVKTETKADATESVETPEATEIAESTEPAKPEWDKVRQQVDQQNSNFERNVLKPAMDRLERLLTTVEARGGNPTAQQQQQLDAATAEVEKAQDTFAALEAEPDDGVPTAGHVKAMLKIMRDQATKIAGLEKTLSTTGQQVGQLSQQEQDKAAWAKWQTDNPEVATEGPKLWNTALKAAQDKYPTRDPNGEFVVGIATERWNTAVEAAKAAKTTAAPPIPAAVAKPAVKPATPSNKPSKSPAGTNLTPKGATSVAPPRKVSDDDLEMPEDGVTKGMWQE